MIHVCAHDAQKLQICHFKQWNMGSGLCRMLTRRISVLIKDRGLLYAHIQCSLMELYSIDSLYTVSQKHDTSYRHNVGKCPIFKILSPLKLKSGTFLAHCTAGIVLTYYVSCQCHVSSCHVCVQQVTYRFLFCFEVND